MRVGLVFDLIGPVMPPRWMTGIIIGFWLATTGWMAYHEISLRYRSGEPPPFGIDLTDEVGANTISWGVIETGERVGSGKSRVKRLDDRTYQLYSDFRFDKESLKVLTFRKITSCTHVTAAGELLDLAAEVEVETRLDPDHVLKAKLSGRVQNRLLVPELTVARVPLRDVPLTTVVFPCDSLASPAGDHDLKVPLNIKAKVPSNVLNPMQLVNKYNGVRAGQSWEVPLLDPTSFRNLTIPLVFAEVSEATLSWRDVDESCYRIDYHEPGKDKVVASTWVRQRDGLVLQQEAVHQGRELILRRDK